MGKQPGPLNSLESKWYRDKTVFLTGATAGIGRAMAVQLAGCGARLLLHGRDRQAMLALKSDLGGKAGLVLDEYFVDLSDMGAVREMCRCAQTHHQVQVLINNAAFGYVGDYAGMPTETVQAMLAANVQAIAEMCRLFIPVLQGRPGCGIMNVGSVASFFPTPGSALYGATKHFVSGLTDALHQELLDSGVHVSGLYPGKTHSKFIDRASGGDLAQWDSASTAEEVARAGLAGLARNRVRVVPKLSDRVKILIAQVMPVKSILRAAYANRPAGKRKA